MKIDHYVLGITKGFDNCIYIATSSSGWLDDGGVIRKYDEFNGTAVIVSDFYSGINGLTSDSEGNLFFTTGNMSFFKPDGAIYTVKHDNTNYQVEEVFIDSLKSPNGLYYDREQNTLVFTEVFSGIKEIDLESGTMTEIFGKTNIVEGFDDLCKDSYGHYWVADPPNGSIKMYDPLTDAVTRYNFEDFGVASSCKIREENGLEILYITEIKKSKKSKEYDGRGVLRVPVDNLINSRGVTFRYRSLRPDLHTARRSSTGSH